MAFVDMGPLPQGNCSDPDAAAALNMSAAESAALLPLKPFQCMLVVDTIWLYVNQGAVWVDNLYLKRTRGPVLLAIPFQFIGAAVKPPKPVGRNVRPKLPWDGIGRSDIFVKNVTFQADYGGNARAVSSDERWMSMYIEGTARLLRGLGCMHSIQHTAHRPRYTLLSRHPLCTHASPGTRPRGGRARFRTRTCLQEQANTVVSRPNERLALSLR